MKTKDIFHSSILIQFLLCVPADMDECVRGTAGCSHTCNNTVGSFQCFCRPGYVLGQDKQTCFGE